jgi:dienelactone hydrolase
VEPVIDDIRDAGKVDDLDFFIYPDAGHGFFNGLAPQGRNLTESIGRPLPPEDVVTLSFERVTAFFAEHLKE